MDRGHNHVVDKDRHIIWAKYHNVLLSEVKSVLLLNHMDKVHKTFSDDYYTWDRYWK